MNTLLLARDAYIIRIPRQTMPVRNSITEEFIKKVLLTIEQNLDNWDFGVPDLAKQMHLSSSQVTRRIKTLLGQPPARLILSLRMGRAAELLQENVAPIGEIAFKVGFKDQGHFCRCFKRYYGCPPSRYLKKEKP